jgi:putative oxidoreductase
MIGGMAHSKTGNAVAWILQIAAAAMFLMAGGSKLAGAPPMVDMFGAIGVGQWFRYVTGTIEVGSALLLLMPSTAAIAAALLVCVMVGAIITHLTILHSSPAMPIVLLVICAIVFVLRRDRLAVRRGGRRLA